MATTRTANKSNALGVQSNLRQSRNVRKPVIEEIDEEAHTDYMDMDDEMRDGEIDASQGTTFQRLIIQGLNDQKKRHVVNKKKVKEDYKTTKTNLQGDIVKLFDEHEDQSNIAHHAQLSRLADLLAMKASLESQMAAKLANLRAAYNTNSKELSAVLDSRIEELK